MLTYLHISNYALIDILDIEFNDGLSIITGETGAGKSIIMGAIGVLLGGRSDVKSIRDDSKKSVIEAKFNVRSYDLREFFEDNELDYDSEECIVRREIMPNGRTRAFVNDTPVSVSVLRELSLQLVDIHSQHSNLLLSQPSYQLDIIDNLAANQELKSAYQTEYKKYTGLKRELTDLRKNSESAKAEADYIRFQLENLVSLKLQPGEDTELESLEKKLSNLSEIKSVLWESDSLLNGDENSIIGNLKIVEKRMSRASELLDEVKDLPARLESTLIELKDIADSISSLQDDLELNPDDYERVQERLNTIYTNERKYGVDSVDGLIKLQEDFARKLDLIDNSDEIIKEKEAEFKSVEKLMLSQGELLRATREKAATEFAQNIKPFAMGLNMKNLDFVVGFEQVEPSASGIDKVQFRASFNKQQTPMAIEDTASGGEISRLMLCIKSIVSRKMNLPTIIFDEVDTGVSGEVASRMGEMMHDLSGHLQVLCITHLPQVAALADTHYLVYKHDDEDSTNTSILKLNEDARVQELAKMLSGKNVTEEAMQNARALISVYKNGK